MLVAVGLGAWRGLDGGLQRRHTAAEGVPGQQRKATGQPRIGVGKPKGILGGRGMCSRGESGEEFCKGESAGGVDWWVVCMQRKRGHTGLLDARGGLWRRMRMELRKLLLPNLCAPLCRGAGVGGGSVGDVPGATTRVAGG